MLDAAALARVAGVPFSQVNELTKRHKMPKDLITKDGKRFTYSPVTVAFFEALELLRDVFGDDSPLPLMLAERATPKLTALWHSTEPIAADAIVSIPCAGATVTLPATLVTRAKAKLTAS